jgi:hypothetical protein
MRFQIFCTSLRLCVLTEQAPAAAKEGGWGAESKEIVFWLLGEGFFAALPKLG